MNKTIRIIYAVLTLTLLVAFAIGCKGFLGAFIDVPAAIVTLSPALAGLVLIYGFLAPVRTVYDFLGIMAGNSLERAELNRAVSNSFCYLINISALVATTIGMVMSLRDGCNDIARLFISGSVAILPILYSLVITVFICLPMKYYFANQRSGLKFKFSGSSKELALLLAPWTILVVLAASLLIAAYVYESTH